MPEPSKDEVRRIKRVKAAKAAYHPRKVPGTPAIGFAAKPVVSPGWTLERGEFELDLIVRSAGGTGRGLAVRVSGAALDAIELESVDAEGCEASFVPDGDGVRAELEEVVITQGYVVPLDPRPSGDIQKGYAEELLRETHMTLTLRGRAKDASRELLRVEVAALGESSTPLSWIRPLIVE